jgi:soluble lytic murein transglycosylase
MSFELSLSRLRLTVNARARTTYRTGSRPPARAARSRDRRPGQRRRATATVIAVGALVALAVVFGPQLDHTVRRLALPLDNEQIIREQAAAKHLDPALIAAVIYAETKFDPRTSPAGAEGLMQIEPATAEYLAKLSGGYKFTVSDLGTPAINVAYGSYYLRYLLNHYENNEMLAIAAYNAGVTNVDEWVAKARSEGSTLTVDQIPFAQTREYVKRVQSAQQEYRALYPRQLGIR